MKCHCCKKVLKNWSAGQKYCNSCSLFTIELRRQIAYWKGSTKKLRKLYYGQENGAERLR